MNWDCINAILSGLGCCGGVAAAVISWVYVRPAEKKLAVVESELQRHNDSISCMRNSFLNSSVRLKEVTYNKIVAACETVYRSFMKTYCASSGLLMICASLRDLDEIRITLRRSGKLDSMREWLRLFVSEEMLVPMKPDDLSVEEIYLPDRVLKLYGVANLLYASAILKMAMLKNGVDVQLDGDAKLYADIDKVIPGLRQFLEEHGTSGYWTSLQSIKTVLLNAIRDVVKSDPIESSDIIAINDQFETSIKIPAVPADIRNMILR